MSHRIEKVTSTLQRAIQQVFARGFADPRIRGLVTVTKVTVSDDLRNATIFISVMPDEHEKLTLHGLRAAVKHIRHEASNLVSLSTMPQLTIKPDTGMKQQREVFEALSKVRQESETTEEQDAATPDQTEEPQP